MDRVDVSFVIPCLNEAETLEFVVNEIRSIDLGDRTFEILIADNGSTDGSIELAHSLGCRIEDIPIRGYGAALRGGIDAALGKTVVMGDADGSYRFSDAVYMIDSVEAGADIAIGNRFAGGIEPGAMPWLHKYLGNPVLSFLGRRLFKLRVGDFHCGLRAFSRESILNLHLSSTGMEFASEMLVVAGLKNLRIEEIPTILRPDGRSRPPHLKTWRDGWRHLKFLFVANPRYLLLYPAVLATVLTSTLLVLTTLGSLNFLGVNFSQRTLVVIAGLDTIALTMMWCYGIARSIILRRFKLKREGKKINPILPMGTAVVCALLGFAIIFSQFWSWGSGGFGFSGTNEDLRYTTLGAFLMSNGIISLSLGSVWVMLEENLLADE